MSDIKTLLAIIERDDILEVEAARDLIKPELLPELADYYKTLNDWRTKLTLVNLIQDYISPATRFIMQDILNAPEQPDNDYVMLTKAAAICHLENSFDRFEDYDHNRNLLRAKVQQYLQQPTKDMPVTRAKQISKAKSKDIALKKKPTLLSIIAIVAIIIGSIITVVGYQTEQTLKTFIEEGQSITARVINKRRLAFRRLCISVSYFDASILKGGKLHRTESCDLVFGSAWKALKKGDRTEILFLPNEPKRFVLKSALQADNVPLLYNISFGLALIVLGAIFSVLNRLGNYRE